MAKRQYTGEPIDMAYQHISERALDEEAETVEYATECENEGEESTDFWPGSATPREELTESQVAVIEAAADPTADYSTATELGRDVVPEKSENYAYVVLYREWPQCSLVGDNVSSDRSNAKNRRNSSRALDPNQVDEIRKSLVDGANAVDLCEEYNVSDSVIRAAAKERKPWYENMDTETSRVGYDNQNGWQFVESGGKKSEQTQTDTDTSTVTKDDRFEKGERKYEHASSPTSDTHTRYKTANDTTSHDGDPSCVGIVAATIVAWEILRWLLTRAVIQLDD